MNFGIDYLHLEVSLNASCTSMNLKIKQFMYVSALGFNGGTLSGEAAFKFLKSTIYGRQPDLCNFFILFEPDADYSTLNIDLSIEIPPINDVKFKNQRRYKRKNVSLPFCNKETQLWKDELMSDTTPEFDLAMNFVTGTI